ncbi:hypothetical protein VJ923_07290 [Adlercreutzia sp. R25]|uniref:hypothetical protein n=1 Tax=Adlercreutzia shanghongiae TaxID=3111773 RepID=UPI002DBFB1CF|nr:hypothetical protein [Adlercreutzia sp. R25]MEC4272958.1 hypothetical protein [Adlercreutzia sp. R25]
MRNLERDTQRVWISRFEGLVPEENAQGRLTGKNIPARSRPELFLPSASMSRGEAQNTYFGLNLDYDRVLTIDDPDFEVGEADVLWLYGDPGDLDDPAPHDAIVKRAVSKGSFTVIATKRVEVSR